MTSRALVIRMSYRGQHCHTIVDEDTDLLVCKRYMVKGALLLMFLAATSS